MKEVAFTVFSIAALMAGVAAGYIVTAPINKTVASYAEERRIGTTIIIRGIVTASNEADITIASPSLYKAGSTEHYKIRVDRKIAPEGTGRYVGEAVVIPARASGETLHANAIILPRN